MPAEVAPSDDERLRAAGRTDRSAAVGIVGSVRDRMAVPAVLALEIDRHTRTDGLRPDERTADLAALDGRPTLGRAAVRELLAVKGTSTRER